MDLEWNGKIKLISLGHLGKAIPFHCGCVWCDLKIEEDRAVHREVCCQHSLSQPCTVFGLCFIKQYQCHLQILNMKLSCDETRCEQHFVFVKKVMLGEWRTKETTTNMGVCRALVWSGHTKDMRIKRLGCEEEPVENAYIQGPQFCATPLCK